MSWKELLAALGQFFAVFALLVFAASEETDPGFAGLLAGLGCAAFGGFLVTTGIVTIRAQKRNVSSTPKDVRRDNDNVDT